MKNSNSTIPCKELNHVCLSGSCLVIDFTFQEDFQKSKNWVENLINKHYNILRESVFWNNTYELAEISPESLPLFDLFKRIDSYLTQHQF